MNGDYLELNLYLDDLEDEASVDLYVHSRERKMLVFKGVCMNPVRYYGQWSITHDFHGSLATSYLPADDVWYFTVIHSPAAERQDSSLVAVEGLGADSLLVEL